MSRRCLPVLIALITGVVIACELPESTPTPAPTPRYSTAGRQAFERATPTPWSQEYTPTPIAIPRSLDVSRQEVYSAFDDLDIGLLPLNTHGDEWVSTMLPNGDISIDIFGIPRRTQAIELWFRIPGSGQMGDVAQAALQIMSPEEWRDGLRWMGDRIDYLNPTGQRKERSTLGDLRLALQYSAKTNRVFFSIDRGP